MTRPITVDVAFVELVQEVARYACASSWSGTVEEVNARDLLLQANRLLEAWRAANLRELEEARKTEIRSGNTVARVLLPDGVTVANSDRYPLGHAVWNVFLDGRYAGDLTGSIAYGERGKWVGDVPNPAAWERYDVPTRIGAGSGEAAEVIARIVELARERREEEVRLCS